MVYTVHIDMELGCIAPYFGIIIIGEVHSVGGTVVTNNHFFAARLGKASKKKLIIFMEFSMEGYPPPRPPPVENN